MIASTLSAVVDVDPKRTQRKVPPISQDGAEEEEGVEVVVEVDEVEVEDEEAVDEVVLVVEEEEPEQADHVRLNDLGNLGESKTLFWDMRVDWLYLNFDLDLEPDLDYYCMYTSHHVIVIILLRSADLWNMGL